MGWEAIRESTSWNQANGSTFTSSQEATKLRSTAAVLPPRSLPKNVQLLRPTAQPRKECSVWLLSNRDQPLNGVLRSRVPVKIERNERQRCLIKNAGSWGLWSRAEPEKRRNQPGETTGPR